jgi:hypothetical protein
VGGAMKKFIPFFLVLFLIINSCKDNEPTAPEETTPTEQALAEKTIGPEGGTLETEDFKLIVPADAFSNSALLKLYANPESDPFGEFSVSKLFRIAGILTNFQQPLQVSIKYSGNLNGVSFITFGKEDTVKLLDTSWVDAVYDLLDAQESGEFLTSEITVGKFAKSTLNKINDNELEFFTNGLTNGRKDLASDHFKIKGVIPKGQESVAYKILDYFEEAYKRFNDDEFDYSKMDWPMEILVEPGPKVNQIRRTWLQENKLHYYNNINLSDKLRSDIVYDFMSNILSTYQDWNEYINVEAVSLWASWQFWNETLYDCVLNLMKFGDINGDYLSQTLLMDYIACTPEYGEKQIAKICKINGAFSYAATEILGNPQKSTWLNQFYEYVMTNEKYNLSNTFFIENSNVQTKIDLNSNSKTFKNDYYPLSAKWFYLELANDLTESTKLNFKTDIATSGISVIKYKPISEKKELIKNGYGAITLNGIKQLANEGYNLFTIVTNNEYDPPFGTKTIRLTIEKTDELSIVGCSIFLRYLTGDFIKQVTNGSPETIKDASLSVGFPKDTARVDYNSSTRTLTQQYAGHKGNDNQYYTENIVITFGDENRSYISSFNADWEVTGSLGTYKNSLSATNISRDISVSFIRFRLAGQNLCDEGKIVNLTKYEDHGTYTYTLVGGSQKCNENSELVVYISTE